MAKTKDPLAAMQRAVERAAELSVEDRAETIRRLESGKPKAGLAGMAYVEEIAESLSAEDRAFLLGKLKKIAPAKATEAEPPAAAQPSQPKLID